MNSASSKISKIKKAFENDHFNVDEKTGVFTYKEKTGIIGIHQTAFNYDTGEYKKAYYIEGNPYELGYLMGLMAEPEVSRMATEFIDNIVIDMIDENLPEILKKIIGPILAKITYLLSQDIRQDVPEQYIHELNGLVDGCKATNPDTKTDFDGLWVLNVGVDCLLSIVYRLDLFLEDIIKKIFQELIKEKDRNLVKEAVDYIEKIRKKEKDIFRIPLLCNAFSVKKSATVDNAHYVGRDFMFSTAGVFQDTAAMTVYNPDPDYKAAVYPLVSMAAPGMIGCVAALNQTAPDSGGVASGMDMVAAGNCDPSRPGMNSLLLIRHIIQHAADTEQACRIMENTQRGVTWLYILADGITDDSCVVEAGRSEEVIDYLSYPDKEMKKLLPAQEYLDENKTVVPVNGLAFRRSNYEYNKNYINDFNKNLFKHFNKTIIPGAFSENGFIDKSPEDHNCPESYYFTPQRENNPDIVLVSNHFITPEMRLCAMHPWCNFITKSSLDNFQWRYDELNSLLLECTASENKIDYRRARDLISFLRPYNPNHNPLPKVPNPDYYNNDKAKRSHDGKEIMIAGSVSLIDLKNKTMESHYGYYCDEWVKITLANYIIE